MNLAAILTAVGVTLLGVYRTTGSKSIPQQSWTGHKDKKYDWEIHMRFGHVGFLEPAHRWQRPELGEELVFAHLVPKYSIPELTKIIKDRLLKDYPYFSQLLGIENPTDFHVKVTPRTPDEMGSGFTDRWLTGTKDSRGSPIFIRDTQENKRIPERIPVSDWMIKPGQRWSRFDLQATIVFDITISFKSIYPDLWKRLKERDATHTQLLNQLLLYSSEPQSREVTNRETMIATLTKGFPGHGLFHELKLLNWPLYHGDTNWPQGAPYREPKYLTPTTDYHPHFESDGVRTR